MKSPLVSCRSELVMIFFFFIRGGVGLSSTSRSFTSSQDFRGFLCNRMRIPVTKERHLLPRLWSHNDTTVPSTLKFCWRRLLRSLISNSRSIVSDVCSRSGSLGNSLLEFYWWSSPLRWEKHSGTLFLSSTGNLNKDH